MLAIAVIVPRLFGAGKSTNSNIRETVVVITRTTLPARAKTQEVIANAFRAFPLRTGSEKTGKPSAVSAPWDCGGEVKKALRMSWKLFAFIKLLVNGSSLGKGATPSEVNLYTMVAGMAATRQIRS